MTGGKLLHAAAVHHIHLGAQALGAAGGIHGHIAAADHSHLLALEVHDGGIGVGLIGLHKVDTGEELIGGIHTLEVLAGDVHEHGQACAGAHKYGLKAVFLHQLVDGDGAAHDDVGLHLHAHGLQAVHFLLHDGLGQTELGNAVHQHAAGQMQGLVHGDIVALLGQVAGAGEAGRAGADHGYLMAVRPGLFGGLGAVGVVPVGHKAFQTADTHGLALLAPDAVHLALGLLGAHTAAHSGQGAGLVDHLIGALVILLQDLLDELGNADIHGAAVDAGMRLAVQAPGSLVQSLLLGIAQSHFQEIMIADIGVLRRHGILILTHIHSHVTLPPSERGCKPLRAYVPQSHDTSGCA